MNEDMVRRAIDAELKAIDQKLGAAKAMRVAVSRVRDRICEEVAAPQPEPIPADG